MENLGHSQVSLTMNTYSHVMPAMQRDGGRPDGCDHDTNRLESDLVAVNWMSARNHQINGIGFKPVE